MRDPDAGKIVPQQVSGGARRAPRRSRRVRSRGASGRGVIQHPAFAVEPWAVCETALDLERLAQTESVFALANGHLGLRANLDEGEPYGLPGTYLAGFYEMRPLPYAEPGYGDPEDGQTVVNVTNGKIIRLAGRGRAVRCPLWRVAQARAGARSARGCASPDGRVGVADGSRSSASRQPGWCPSPSGRSRRSSTRSSRSKTRCGSWSSQSW